MPKDKGAKVPKALETWDMDVDRPAWNQDDTDITITPQNLNRIWRKQNEIIAFLKEKFEEAEDAKG